MAALVMSNKSDAAVTQARIALAHALSLTADRKNIAELGMAECHINPEYSKKHIQFWIRASALIDETQKELTETQQSLN
jgi:hypothetical protein